MEEADWERLIDQLRNGECTPFLGAGACYGVLPTGTALSEEWAATYKYPFTDRQDLARVMQYAALTVGDTVSLKERICREFRTKGPPDFTHTEEPHALLAEFPLPVFLTTNYDNFLVQALTRAGKTPQQAVCPWHEDASDDSELFESVAGIDPKPEKPIVYHLHGSLRNPTSLVLTEDDYLEFLVSIARANAEDDRRLVPGAILTALTTRPLLFIGYGLQDWTFRLLFHGLLRTIPNINRRRHVSVQLPPTADESVSDAEKRAKKYLTRYLEDQKITIFWGTAAEFCAELRKRMGAT